MKKNSSYKIEAEMDKSSFCFALETAISIMLYKNTSGYLDSAADVVVSSVILYEVYSQVLKKDNIIPLTTEEIVLHGLRIEHPNKEK